MKHEALLTEIIKSSKDVAKTWRDAHEGAVKGDELFDTREERDHDDAIHELNMLVRRLKVALEEERTKKIARDQRRYDRRAFR